MTSDDLSIEQAEKLRDQIAVRLLTKLESRLKTLGFPPDDKLYYAATVARAQMQNLHVAAHYTSCKSGVGRPEEGTK